MCFGSPSVPAPPPAPPPPPSLPDQGVQNAGQNQRNLAAMAYGAEPDDFNESAGVADAGEYDRQQWEDVVGRLRKAG